MSGSPIGQPGYFGQLQQQGGSPSSFTSPPINPQALQALMALFQQSQSKPGGAGLPGTPQPAQTPGGQPSPQALAALNPGGVQPGGGMGGIDPAMLKAIIQRLMQGGGAGLGAAPGLPARPMQ